MSVFDMDCSPKYREHEVKKAKTLEGYKKAGIKLADVGWVLSKTRWGQMTPSERRMEREKREWQAEALHTAGDLARDLLMGYNPDYNIRRLKKLTDRPQEFLNCALEDVGSSLIFYIK